MPPTTEPRTQLIRASTELLDLIGTRSASGWLLSYEWGEPDADGVYTPTITTTDDGWLAEQRAEAARLALEEVAERVRGLPEHAPCVSMDSGPTLDRAAVLALLSDEEEGS